MGLLSSNCLFCSSQKARDKAPLVPLSLKNKNDGPNRNTIVRVSPDQIEDHKTKQKTHTKMSFLFVLSSPYLATPHEKPARREEKKDPFAFRLFFFPC
jgi:hypothetical protein